MTEGVRLWVWALNLLGFGLKPEGLGFRVHTLSGYVCMYVCMYVILRMYVCMHACI